MIDLKKAIAAFGTEAKAKLANPSATGEPEDQLRAPLEGLFSDLTELCGFQREWVTAVGESSLSTLKTRPDYAITLRNVLVGYVEVKAPGKGADPRRYKGHDKEQWEKLQSLPNLLYTDGNSFSLWQNGPAHGLRCRCWTSYLRTTGPAFSPCACGWSRRMPIPSKGGGTRLLVQRSPKRG